MTYSISLDVARRFLAIRHLLAPPRALPPTPESVTVEGLADAAACAVATGAGSGGGGPSSTPSEAKSSS